MKIFGSFPGILGNQQSNYINVIKHILEKSLDDFENQAIRYEAVKSFTAFIIFNKNDENVKADFVVNFFLQFCLSSAIQFSHLPRV